MSHLIACRQVIQPQKLQSSPARPSYRGLGSSISEAGLRMTSILPMTSGYMRERHQSELNLHSTSQDNLLRNPNQLGRGIPRISTQQGLAIEQGKKEAEAYIKRVSNYKVMQKRIYIHSY